MRPHAFEFLKLCAQALPCPDPIVEIGAYQVAGQEAISDLRPLFPGRNYFGCDMQPGPGVDRIENIHALSFGDGEVGTFLLSDTLEHVADPIRAMAEIRRCLRPDGVAIYISVMNFPIHGYPNDYWRFTPEAFRALGADFARTMIFFCGPKDHPHTVCGVAVGSDFPGEKLRALETPARALKQPAPMLLDGRGARVVRALAGKILPLDAGPAAPSDNAGLERLETAGWWLVTGQWLRGWTTAPGVEEVEILAGDAVVHRARLRARPELAERLGFVEQVDLSSLGDYVGTLRMTATGADGARQVLCESAPGLALGSIKLETAFVMHSFDEHLPSDPHQAGRELVAAIRGRGEKVRIDLGCGFRKKGNLGIDLKLEGTQADLVCRLGFAPIPLDDACAHTVYCKDFLEHLPKGYFSEREQVLRYPIIELMNEVWRVLKPGGTFTSLTPCHPAVEVHRDPTHLSVWTLETMPYFCGTYRVAEAYGVRCQFELVKNELERFYLHAVLRKPKTAAAA